MGPWDKQLRDADLGALVMTIHHNGELAAEGLGSAALGHPATSTAWLVINYSSLAFHWNPEMSSSPGASENASGEIGR